MASTKKRSGGGKTPRSARRGEPEAKQRARLDRIAAERRTNGTESPRSKRSIAQHSEHPESRADSTVRHAEPATGHGAEGQKGFPQGEYDVTDPAHAGPDNRSVEQILLDQHFGDQDVSAHLGDANRRARLPLKTLLVVLETLPQGVQILRDGINAWKVAFGNKTGHGTSLREAAESFVLGNAPGDASTQAWEKLSPRQRQEIEDRDRAAAKRVGQKYEDSPEYLARKEAIENASAEKSAGVGSKVTPDNTDGAARASARDKAGQSRGRSLAARQLADDEAGDSSTSVGTDEPARPARSKSRRGTSSRKKK